MRPLRPLFDNGGTSTGMQLINRTAPKMHGSTCTMAHGCEKPAPSNSLQHSTAQAPQEANTGEQAGVKHYFGPYLAAGGHVSIYGQQV